jgi:hypothetical protein
MCLLSGILKPPLGFCPLRCLCSFSPGRGGVSCYARTMQVHGKSGFSVNAADSARSPCDVPVAAFQKSWGLPSNLKCR